MSTAPISKILTPVDLSSCSRAALEFACKLAAPFGAGIEVLLVRPLHGVTPMGESDVSVVDQLAAIRDELHRFVLSTPGTRPRVIAERVETGDPHEAIIRAAESGGFDAIVLGTHGRTGRARSLAGSVAESVVRTAACPVITVREPR
jgi:nucleotide-binding universal stress UspA family protein